MTFCPCLGAPLRRLSLLTALACVALTACSNTSVGEAGCDDLVRAIGDVAVRCGFDRRANEAAFEANVTLGRGCGGVDELRDERSFYDSCIPGVEAFSCAMFDDPNVMFPASCQGQLIIRE